jgi:hypothetical protein
MAYIYMDESGDLGFNENWGSKYFIITFLISKSEKDMEIIMKNVRKRAVWSKMKIYWTFFHSHKSSKNVVKRVLDLTSRRDIFSVALFVKKENIPTKFRNNIHRFYNYMVWELLEICQKRWLLNRGEKHTFIASRRETNKQLNTDFIEYLKSKKYELFKFEFKISTPNQIKWLEVVDAISFAIEQKYEKWDLELYSVIKNKIILEKQIFN